MGAATGEDGKPVGAAMEFMGVSPDLRELAFSDFDRTTMTVVDARTGTRLASLPVPGLDPTAPVAFDPTRPNVVVQSGAGALTVADWTQYGARPFVTTAPAQPLPATTVVSATGTPIDLTPALRELGLPTGCSAPLYSSCDYTTDRSNLDNYFEHRAVLNPKDPRHTWSATVSAAGEVAIVGGGTITIWNPTTHHIERRLTGVPECANFLPHDLAFNGTARRGRIVLACSPNPVSWDLASATPKPAWTQSWLGLDPTTAASPPGVVLTADGTRGAVAGQDLTAQIFDPRTGRAGPTGPTTTYDGLSALSFAPDDTLGQLHISGALDLVDSADGSPQRTLVSRTGNVGDSGAPLAFHGAGAGATPKIAFSPDNATVAVAHDSIGVELWDRQTGESLALLGGFLTPAERNIEPTPVNGERATSAPCTARASSSSTVATRCARATFASSSVSPTGSRRTTTRPCCAPSPGRSDPPTGRGSCARSPAATSPSKNGINSSAPPRRTSKPARHCSPTRANTDRPNRTKHESLSVCDGTCQ